MKLSIFAKFLPLALALGFTSCVAIDPAMLDVAGGGGRRPDYDQGRDYNRRPDYDRGRDYDRRPDYDGGHSRSYDSEFGPASYNKGYLLGKEDGRSGRSDNHSRHRGEYNPRFESSFSDGYHKGFEEGRSRAGGSNYFGGPREWYKSGVGIGKRDRQEHRSSDYRRHSSQYDRKTEAQFAEGYRDGYEGRSH